MGPFTIVDVTLDIIPDPMVLGHPSLERQLLNEGEVDQGRLPRGQVSQGDAVPEVGAISGAWATGHPKKTRT